MLRYKLFLLYQVLHYSSYFCLLSIFSTFHFSSPSNSTGFGFFTLYLFTDSQYLTTQLIFMTEWILIVVSSFSLTVLVDTTSLMVYGLT